MLKLRLKTLMFRLLPFLVLFFAHAAHGDNAITYAWDQ